MGWDSFGLPAQNAAIQRGISPKTWTENNIREMKEQLIQLGITLDWDREIATHSVEYYKWTQYLFTLMMKRGLAYKKESEVNWDPIDKTVLANQQVDSNGMSWRSGAKVEKKRLNQWFLKITDYAERLIDGLNQLDWPTKVKEMQKGWIGLRKGYVVDFGIKQGYKFPEEKVNVEVFIDSMEDLRLCRLVTIPWDIEEPRRIGTCINPITMEQVPIVLINAPMYETVECFAGIPSKQPKIAQLCKKYNINIESTPVKINQISQLNYYQTKITLLKDWLVSRQRYWGAPIPAIYCPKCGCIPSSLPVVLPQTNSIIQNPLTLDTFKNCKCLKCNSDAVRQSDTLDTFVDSSWYYLRYLNPKNLESMVNKKQNNWMGVDVYIGGIEHAIMHLLYARFVYKVLHDQGIVSEQQPFYRLIDQGLVKGKTFKLKSNNQYITLQDASNYKPQQLIQTFQKMSKSKFNGISPILLTDKYGSDALRLALLSVPYDKDIDFTETDVKHKLQFIQRVYSLAERIDKCDGEKSEKSGQVMERVSKLLKDMETSMEKYNLHVYQARVMELFNVLKQVIEGKVSKKELLEIFKVFVSALYPICPYLSRQLISKLSPFITIQQKWPELTRTTSQFTQLLLSINGKFVQKLKIQKSIISNSNQLLKLLKQNPKLSKKLNSHIKQTILKQTKIGYIMNILVQ